VRQDGAFRAATYFFDRPKKLKDRRVDSILFFGSDKLLGALHTKLIEALGQPAVSGPEKDCFIWPVDKLFVRQQGPNVFAIGRTVPNCNVQEK